MITIDIWKDPYDTGVGTTKAKQIELVPGLTVLVGCNGAGKTTLLDNIKEELKKVNTPYHYWNNLNDGAHNTISALIGGYNEYSCDSLGLGALMFCSSEGENIKLNMARRSTLFDDFIKTGYFKDRKYYFVHDEDENPISESNKRFLLFDATDSGLSIDNVIDMKELFNNALTKAAECNVELYIIISANEYELCNGEHCLDVIEGKYVTFSSYEDYKQFILKSREKKSKRIDKQIQIADKRHEQAVRKYEKMKEKTAKQIAAIEEKAIAKHGSLSWNDKYRIDSLKRILSDFANDHHIKEKKDEED